VASSSKPRSAVAAPETVSLEEKLSAAHATIEVLKRKVVSLYGGTASGAVTDQFARRRQRQARARRRRELLEIRAAELARHNERLEQEVADRTRALRHILDNVAFGFLVVGPDLQVREGFTRSCEALLGRPVFAGQPVAEALGLDDVGAAELRFGTGVVFADRMPELVTLSQLPQHVEVGERTLRLDASVVRDDDDGSPSALLLTLTDISGQLEAERRGRHHARLVEILRQRGAFEAFVDDARTLLDRCAEGLVDQAAVRRAIHTLKGNAACFWLDEVVAACHAVETHDTIDEEAIERLHQAMGETLAGFADVTGIRYAQVDAGDVRVSRARWSAFLDRISDGTSPRELRAAAMALLECPARDLLGPVESFTRRLGSRLGKSVVLHTRGIGTPVDPDVMRPVLRTVSHLLRNAVHHGIEPEGGREAKPAIGRVVLEVGRSADGYRVEVSDDGAGLDTGGLVQGAVARGLLTASEAGALSQEERWALVFREGLSSTVGATEAGGRGVGMAAVLEAVEAVDGSIQVSSEPGLGTTFILDIPA